MAYAYLLVAIVSEVVATSALKASQSFTRLGPSLVTVAGYVVAFYFLSLTLAAIPIGVAYAVWSGVGIVLIALVGALWFGHGLDIPAMIGVALILAGVVTINLFSGSATY